MFRSNLPIAASLLAAAILLPACGTASKTPAPTVASLAGTWSMDLSPAQDKSYLKDFVVIPSNDPAGITFTGTVYGGSTYDNGLAFTRDNLLCFSMVSDEEGKLGGPYYWLGTAATPELLTGRVRSISRSLQMSWSARRAGQPSAQR